MEKVPMTTYGQKKLEAELKQLKEEARPQVIEEIAEAREHGDLKENAEYHAAKEKQGFIEGRIQELESVTSRAQVVDPLRMEGDRIVLSATVQLVDADTDKEVTYVLVGPEEADLDKGLISTTSPLGRAMMGKEEGDEIIFRAPGGTHTYEVLSVEFKEIVA